MLDGLDLLDVALRLERLEAPADNVVVQVCACVQGLCPDTLAARLLNVKVNKGLILRHGLDPGGEPELAGGDH